jgi:hypothetical protein
MLGSFGCGLALAVAPCHQIVVRQVLVQQRKITAAIAVGTIREAATAIIIPMGWWARCVVHLCQWGRGSGPDPPSGAGIRMLERDGKLSFASQKIHERFLKLRARVDHGSRVGANLTLEQRSLAS